MSDRKKEERPANAAENLAVVCAKCGFTNRGGDDFCDQCNANLFIRCDQCGRRNQRIRSRCAECGHRLHRWFWRCRYRLNRLFPPTSKIQASHLVLFVILILIVYKLIIMIAGYHPPSDLPDTGP